MRKSVLVTLAIAELAATFTSVAALNWRTAKTSFQCTAPPLPVTTTSGLSHLNEKKPVKTVKAKDGHSAWTRNSATIDRQPHNVCECRRSDCHHCEGRHDIAM